VTVALPPPDAHHAPVLGGLYEFLNGPRPDLAPLAPGQRRRTYAVLWASCLAASIVGSFFASIGQELTSAQSRLDDIPILTLFFLAAIVAPLLEEVAFRLAVTTFSVWRVAVSAAGLALFVPRVGILVAVVALAAVAVPASRHRLRRAWAAHFGVVVYGSALLFGLVHVANWRIDASLQSALGVPLLVAPQLLIGLILTYGRVRLGLIGSILVHAAYNGTVLALALAAGS